MSAGIQHKALVWGKVGQTDPDLDHECSTPPHGCTGAREIQDEAVFKEGEWNDASGVGFAHGQRRRERLPSAISDITVGTQSESAWLSTRFSRYVVVPDCIC